MKKRRKILSLLLCMTLCLGLIPMESTAVFAINHAPDTERSVQENRDAVISTTDELKNAIDSSSGTRDKPAVINVGTFEVTERIDIENKHIILTGGTLTFNDGTHIHLTQSSLTLEAITLEGAKTERGETPLVNLVGHSDLIMEQGAVLQNNMDSAVKIRNGEGNFLMRGGKICNNTAEKGSAISVLGQGSSRSRVEIQGGEISGNTNTADSTITSTSTIFAGYADIRITGGTFADNGNSDEGHRKTDVYLDAKGTLTVGPEAGNLNVYLRHSSKNPPYIILNGFEDEKEVTTQIRASLSHGWNVGGVLVKASGGNTLTSEMIKCITSVECYDNLSAKWSALDLLIADETSAELASPITDGAPLSFADMDKKPTASRDSEKWSWDKASKTFTIKKNMEISTSETSKPALELPSGAVIIVEEGVTGTFSSASNSIYCHGGLTIQGPGTLIVKQTGENNSCIYCYGSGSLIIENVTIEMDGITRGIGAYSTEGEVKIKNAKINVKNCMAGIYTQWMSISVEDSVLNLDNLYGIVAVRPKAEDKDIKVTLKNTAGTMGNGNPSGMPVTVDLPEGTAFAGRVSIDNLPAGYKIGQYRQAASGGLRALNYELILDENNHPISQITLDKKVPVEGVSLAKEITLERGSEEKLIAEILPENATNKAVIWNSSEPEVAAVNENGLVKALKEGTTVITVTTIDGNHTAICEVTVTESATPPAPPIVITYYDITADQPEHGTITLERDRIYCYGDVDVTLTPEEGYEVKDLLINGVSVGAVSNYTIKDVTEDIHVTAVFGETDATKKARIIKGVQETNIKLTYKMNEIGRGFIKIRWTKEKGYAVDYYEVFRSAKNKSNFSKEAYFIKNTAKLNSWYKNTKEIKKSTRYYYKVRGVREIDGKTYYTKWSNTTWRTGR